MINQFEGRMAQAVEMIRRARGCAETVSAFKDCPEYHSEDYAAGYRQKKGGTIWSCWIGSGEFAVCIASGMKTQAAAKKAYKSWRVGK